jgi:hypothetical protein
MAVSYNDKYLLSQDATFQNRVQASLLSACVAIANEGWAIAFHRERAQRCTEILQSPNAPMNWVQLFTNTVANDATVIADATQAGTVAITTANRAAQAALVTDAHIDAAISSQFNAFIREPGN